MNKKIAFVKESKDKVQAYDDKGNYMFTKYGKMSSYTSDNISIKNSSGRNTIYDAKGSYKFTR
jgi:hypothetical protein